MHTILELFAENTVLLLFTLIGVGMVLGKIKVKGISLGAAAVLFISMGFSALANSYDVEIILDHRIGILGLVLFTFAIGMNSGPNFFKILKKSILPILALITLYVIAASVAYFVGKYVLNMSTALLGGTFAGALTNTPTLSAVGNASGNLNEATVGYALSYIYGVIGMLVFSFLALRYRRKDKDLPEKIYTQTVRVESDLNLTVGEVSEKYGSKIKFPRIAHGEHDHVTLPSEDELLREGDLVTIVGSESVVKEAIEYLGHRSSHSLDNDRSEMDMRRITISNPKFSGRRIKDLGIEDRFQATISRVRRGDVDMFADPNLRLQQGDRVRVVVPWDRLKEMNEYFGDSVRGLVDINPVALGFGMALGILIGEMPILAPSGEYFSIGSAAGTLLVGIVFGYLGKIGSIPLTIPYTVCQVLSELGLIIFLAQAGTNAGRQVSDAFVSGAWIKIMVLGFIITTIVGAGLYLVMRYGFKMGGTRLSGLLGGAQTQPAVLAFASNATEGDPRVALGYAMVYPVAMIVKIFLGQILGGL